VAETGSMVANLREAVVAPDTFSPLGEAGDPGVL
jgi:hypothetical protein